MHAEAAGSFLKHIRMKRTSRSDIPLTSMSSPERVNSGRASSGKLSSEVNIFCVMAAERLYRPP